MSQAMRKLAGIINKTKTVAIFINQIREKVGVMFGNPETTSGGRALKFYATIRLDIRRVDQIKQGTEAIGTSTKVRVVKNKVAPPFKVAEVELIFGKGISYEGEVLDMATNMDIVQKSGSWFSYNGERLGQGRENIKEMLVNNQELTKELETKIREKLKG
jgi:recombination protein RecA